MAVFTKEAVGYLGQRPEMLTVTIDDTPRTDGPGRRRRKQQPARVRGGRFRTLRSRGRGVRVESVVPGSPAASAGVESGDVLLALAGQSIENLQGYTDLLQGVVTRRKRYPPKFSAAVKTFELEVTLKER